MPITLDLVLLIVALICFVLQAIGLGWSRVHLGWLGLALWVLTALI